jgi:tRNA(fMet)-specific endonuclease VapC
MLSAVLRRDPNLEVVRRLARIPAEQQFTTAVTLGELLYGAARRGNEALGHRIRQLLSEAVSILPFDEDAAEVYGPLRAGLEAARKRLDEPYLRIASIALANDLILVTGNVRHFQRVPGLTIEDWLN